nr:DUF3445 domain-containing protein [uncultured Roseobacter sp.]
MPVVLQAEIPPEMRAPRALPGVQPLGEAAWLRVDEAYAGQMAQRRALIATRREAVFWQDPASGVAAQEVLDTALELLPALGFAVSEDVCLCPDGVEVPLGRDSPLAVLGQLVQEDICLMEKRAEAHVLVGACLCFPASWQLSEKAGQPLVAIHAPVPEYDAGLAARVQRLFDGVQVGRPLWRSNRLWYDDPALFQPRSATAPRRMDPGAACANYERAERQCILRLPRSRTVVFSIHTYVVAAGEPVSRRAAPGAAVDSSPG